MQLRDRVGSIRAVFAGRAIYARAISGPGFRFPVARLHEKREVWSLSSREHGHRIGMAESCQVPEIAVLSEGELGIRRAHGEPATDENRDGIRSEGFEQLLTPFRKHGRSLSNQGKGGTALRVFAGGSFRRG